MTRALLSMPIVILMLLLTGQSAADDIGKIVGQVEAAGHSVPATSVLKNACDADAICVAKFLQGRIGSPAELIPDEHQQSSRSKWGAKGEAIAASDTLRDGTFVLRLRHFDVDAIVSAIAGTNPKPARLAFDIRALAPGQKLHDMRRVVGLFTGKIDRAFRVRHISGKEVDWTVPSGSAAVEIGALEIDVWVGPETDAVGEAFAALLRKHAGAPLFGSETSAHGYLFRRIQITHGWTLKVPRARIVQLDDEINVGLKPIGKVPE